MEEKYVEVKGIRTRYLEGGSGEPLLLLHGGHFGMNSSASGWAPVIDSFAESFHVFAPDKVGCGFTDNPKSDAEYLMGTMVQHVYDFLNTMRVDSAHMVGHSRGGYAVIRLALEHPEMVKTLVIVDSGTLMLARNPLYDEWEKQAALIKDVRERHRYQAAANSFGSEHITGDFLDKMIEIEKLPKSQEAAAKMKAGLMSQFKEDLAIEQKETHERIRSGGIKAPTLIMWGFNDPTAKFDPMGLFTLQLILPSTPRSQMHILNEAGHWCFREQPEAFVAAVTSFIKSS